MQIIVNKLLTNYTISGQGPNLLILHGWGSNQDVFEKLTLSLNAKYQVISLDLPGMGKSEPPAEPWSLDDYKKFITSFLAKLKIEKLEIIIGHSNGGALAIKMATDQDLQPKLKAKKLILMGSAGIRDKEKLKKNVFKVIAKSGKLVASFLPSSASLKLKKMLYQSAGSEALDNPNLERTFRLVVNEDISELSSKINIPTLLIYGENDEATPPEYGQILHQQIKESELEIVPNAGHYVFLDQPGSTLNLIERFLK